MISKKQRLLLVGCGAMGGALLKAWTLAKLDFDIRVIDPGTGTHLKSLEDLSVKYCPNIVIFAVKPQLLPQILPDYKIYTKSGCLFISIAAGMGLSFFHNILGKDEFIIRAMPNLPATVREGITALTSRNHVPDDRKDLAEALFSACGKVIWVDQESLMDVVTAVSGSGPGYVFNFVEALAKAAELSGLPAWEAQLLARQTVIGAGMMLQQLPDPADALRKKVTSPGGTTEAGISVFNQEDRLQKLMIEVVKAATQRAHELNYKE
jgi:pyrroline-5-carboxylate reductase